MPFPQTPRVIYEKNPLERVICELRFPPILAVDTIPPAEFQEDIRKEYPLYSELSETQAPIPTEMLQQIPQAIVNTFFKAVKKHEFQSYDEQWIVTLTRQSLSLTALKYETWDDYKSHLELPLEALIERFGPAFFSRIGLRYQNVIRRSYLDLEEEPWSELLERHIAAEFASDISDSINEAGHTLVVQLNNVEGQVRIQHGLIQNLTDEKGKRCYLIDNDFFREGKIDVGDAKGILNGFNATSGHLFRWCISRKLHTAMGPRSLEENQSA